MVMMRTSVGILVLIVLVFSRAHGALAVLSVLIIQRVVAALAAGRFGGLIQQSGAL